jgi:helix-turn-helix protein
MTLSEIEEKVIEMWLLSVAPAEIARFVRLDIEEINRIIKKHEAMNGLTH